ASSRGSAWRQEASPCRTSISMLIFGGSFVQPGAGMGAGLSGTVTGVTSLVAVALPGCTQMVCFARIWNAGRSMRGLVKGVVAVLAICLASQSAHADTSVAFVVGNSNYQNVLVLA